MTLHISNHHIFCQHGCLHTIQVKSKYKAVRVCLQNNAIAERVAGSLDYSNGVFLTPLSIPVNTLRGPELSYLGRATTLETIFDWH